jgi:hypothetical protein
MRGTRGLRRALLVVVRCVVVIATDMIVAVIVIVVVGVDVTVLVVSVVARRDERRDSNRLRFNGKRCDITR